MEEEQDHSRPLQIPSSTGDGVASSSSSLPLSHLHEDLEATTAAEVQVQVHPPDDVTTDRRPRRDHRRFPIQDAPRNASYRFNFTISNIVPRDGGDDIWSCLAVLVTFWFFASMTLILGFYGSLSLQLGPNCSQLITANELFVQSIQAQETEGSSGPLMYGFHTSPSLDVETTWSETHDASVESNFHKEWLYYLNAGSKVDISYDVKNSNSSLSLVIAQGEESLIEWIEDPSYPNTTLNWNTVYGSGNIEQEITSSDTYYVAVGNLNSDTAKVQLNLTMKALLYNTTQAYYKCSLYNQSCSFSLPLFKKNAVIITSPGPEQVNSDDIYTRLSYGPRWLAYIIGSGILTIVVLLLCRFCNMFQPSHGGDEPLTQPGPRADNEEALLSPKDDDLSSWGSSYDSVSNDEDELDEQQPKEGENSANPKKLCVICFDSPTDCFFLPCGHCAACFTCGSRIAEEAGTCPICRKRMKKVRKIFSV